MRTTADAVIIGGGAVGSSICFYLAKLGMKNIVLLEKGCLASGSTGASAAIFRQHYSNQVSIKLVKKSLEIFQGFANEFDGAEVFSLQAGFSLFHLMLRARLRRTWSGSYRKGLIPGSCPQVKQRGSCLA